MMKSIEEVEKMVQECQEAIEEIKRGESGEWKPSQDEECYYVDLDCMDVIDTYWENDENDKTRLENKVVFETKDEAEEYLEYLKVKKKAINEFSKEEWKDDSIDKFTYFYEPNSKKIELTAYFSMKYHIPYFRSKEEAQDFIDKYEKFIKREMGI